MEITDDMVKRACAAWDAAESKHDNDPIIWNDYARNLMRAALVAALSPLT